MLLRKLKYVSVTGFNVFIVWKTVIFEAPQLQIFIVEGDVDFSEFIDFRSCIMDIRSSSSTVVPAVQEANW